MFYFIESATIIIFSLDLYTFRGRGVVKKSTLCTLVIKGLGELCDGHPLSVIRIYSSSDKLERPDVSIATQTGQGVPP
jgi:hypothetical protein